MPPERLLLRYSEGQTEWRLPPVPPDVGDTVERGGQQWTVASVEPDGDDVTVAVLRRGPDGDRAEVAQPGFA